jgi:hypothetical protein
MKWWHVWLNEPISRDWYRRDHLAYHQDRTFCRALRVLSAYLADHSECGEQTRRYVSEVHDFCANRSMVVKLLGELASKQKPRHWAGGAHGRGEA